MALSVWNPPMTSDGILHGGGTMNWPHQDPLSSTALAASIDPTQQKCGNWWKGRVPRGDVWGHAFNKFIYSRAGTLHEKQVSF